MIKLTLIANFEAYWLMSFLSQRNIKYLLTINIFVLLILPQLNNVHYDPLPQFWAETTTAWAAISLFLITCLTQKNINIPKISLPLVLLTIYVAIQPTIIHISFPGLSYIAALEFFICILLSIAISSIVNEYGISFTVTTISQAIVTGAIIQSIIGFLQYTGHYNLLGDLIFYDSAHPTTNIFGHFGQRNHYCHYLSWAVFGLIYLYISNKIERFNFYTILLWLMFSMTIASSRSVFIYFALAILISGLYLAVKRDKTSGKLFILILISTIILCIFEYGYPLMQHLMHGHSQIQSGLQRLSSAAADNGTDRRLVEWHKAWITFKTYPLFGVGLNEFSHQSVYLQPLFKHTPANDGLFTNCHNLILQFLAETGIIGTMIILLGSIWVLYNLIKQSSTEIIVILCMIATTLAHSMVEYPLWYMYFLCPFIIFLSLDKKGFILNKKIVLSITTLPIILVTYLLITGSILFNTLVYYIDPPSDKNQFISQVKYLEDIVNNNIIWAYPALYTLDNYIAINTPNTKAALDINRQFKYEKWFTDSHPYPDNLIKLAMLNWDLGNHTEAKQDAQLAIMAFPVYKSGFLTSLKDKKYKDLYDIIRNYQE